MVVVVPSLASSQRGRELELLVVVVVEMEAVLKSANSA